MHTTITMTAAETTTFDSADQQASAELRAELRRRAKAMQAAGTVDICTADGIVVDSVPAQG